MTITTYQEAHKTAIGELIINIQRGEFNVPLTLADQPDLADIPNFYQQDKGNFWVALNDEAQVVGTIAVIDIGDESGTIRKMFVHRDYRGKEFGIAQRMFDTLIAWGNKEGLKHFYLGTLERLGAARRFYERNGFTAIEKIDLPSSFPIMAVDTHFYQLHF